MEGLLAEVVAVAQGTGDQPRPRGALAGDHWLAQAGDRRARLHVAGCGSRAADGDRRRQWRDRRGRQAALGADTLERRDGLDGQEPAGQVPIAATVTLSSASGGLKDVQSAIGHAIIEDLALVERVAETLCSATCSFPVKFDLFPCCGPCSVTRRVRRLLSQAAEIEDFVARERAKGAASPLFPPC